MQNLQSDLTGLHDRPHTLPSDMIKKRGKSPMVTIDNMHQGYIFRVWSVALLVIMFAYFTSYTFLRVRGQEGE